MADSKIENSKMAALLLAIELEAYDVVPDGRLYLEDFENGGKFDQEKFETFVQRFIRTDDRDTRSAFRRRMEYPLWNKVGKRIREIDEGQVGDKILKARIKYILTNEFSEKEYGGSAQTEYEYESGNDDSDGYVLDTHTHTSTTGGSAWWRRPIHGKFLLQTGGALSGIETWRRQTETYEGASNEDNSAFPGAKISADAGIRTIESDAFKLSLDGSYKTFHKPPRDSLLYSRDISTSAETRKVGGLPLSISANGKYSSEEYTDPPPESGYFRKYSETREGGVAGTYRIARKWGLILDGGVSDENVSEHEEQYNNFDLGAAMLAQYTTSGNYVRTDKTLWITPPHLRNQPLANAHPGALSDHAQKKHLHPT